MTSKTNSILFASLIAITVVAIGGLDSAYAFNYSYPDQLSEKEVKKITSLAKQTQFITELRDELVREDSKANQKTIEALDTKLEAILDYANPLGFYSHEQYAKESLDKRTTPTSAEKSEFGEISKICGCEEIAFRAGFQYKLWGFTADTHGSWKYLTVLNVPLTSTANVGSFVPDWVKPYGQGYQVGTSGGDLEYTLELQNSSGGLVKDYGNHIKALTSTSPWFPNQWNESQYNNPAAYDKVVMVGNADSWT